MAVGLGRKRKRRRRGWRAGMMRLLRQARRLSVAPIRKMRPADGKPGNRTLNALYNGTSSINEVVNVKVEAMAEVKNPNTL